MRFGNGDVTIVKIVKCGKCGLYHAEQVGPWKVSCAVAHQPGDCCHYGERQLAEDDVRVIQNIISRGANNV